FEGLADYSLRSGTPATFVARFSNGFGLLPAALMVPGAALVLRPGRREAGVLLAGTATVQLLLTFFVGFWEPRYVLSELALACSLAGVALQSLAERVGRRMRPALGWALPLLAAALAIRGAWPAWGQHLQDVREILSGGREAFIEAHVPHLALARWLNAHMGPHDRVAIGFNVQPFYYLDGSYYHIHPLTQGDLVSAATPEEVE